MKFPKHPTSTYVSSDVVRMCKHFAQQSYLTNIDCYRYRKQTSPEKIQQDITIGKLAEWGVYFIYLDRGWNDITSPDMKIYPAEQKSFSADLIYTNSDDTGWTRFNLHIKSQTDSSADKFGDSWIFQTKDPLFDNAFEHDIIVGCRVNLDKAHIQIRLEKPFLELNFADTKLNKFKDNKRAIYLKDNE